jgi:hypothetical protein
MRQVLLGLVSAMMIGLTGLVPFAGTARVYAAAAAIEDQISDIIIERSDGKRISVVILGFSAIGAGQLSEDELKDIGTRCTKKLMELITKKITDAGRQNNVILFDRTKLDELLHEKKIAVAGLNDLSLAALGPVLGLDLIITGNVRVEGDSLTITARLARLEDGEVQRTVKQEGMKKTALAPGPPVVLVAAKEKVKIGAWKIIPLNLTSPGLLNVTVNVVRGNPADISVLPGSELVKLKEGKAFDSIDLFKAVKVKKYERSAFLDAGELFLVIRDTSLGMFSTESSDLEISVKLIP